MQCTEKYFEADAFRTRAESVLLAAVPDSRTGGGLIALEGTVFYPEGGGQPADRGTLTLPDGTALTEAASPAETAALERAEAFNSRFRDWAGADGFDEVTAWAEEELAFRTESGGNWTPYTLELDCSVYQTEQMVCIQAEYYSYTGGAHPNTVLLAWNFDLMTGQFFAPEILAADGQIFLDAVRDEIIRQIDMLSLIHI